LVILEVLSVLLEIEVLHDAAGGSLDEVIHPSVLHLDLSLPPRIYHPIQRVSTRKRRFLLRALVSEGGEALWQLQQRLIIIPGVTAHYGWLERLLGRGLSLRPLFNDQGVGSLLRGFGMLVLPACDMDEFGEQMFVLLLDLSLSEGHKSQLPMGLVALARHTGLPHHTRAPFLHPNPILGVLLRYRYHKTLGEILIGQIRVEVSLGSSGGVGVANP
jgi:hypothetical protein